MKKALLFLSVVALTTAPVNAVQVEGNKLILSPQELQACAEQGGCELLTRLRLQQELGKAFKAGQQQCGTRT